MRCVSQLHAMMNTAVHAALAQAATRNWTHCRFPGTPITTDTVNAEHNRHGERRNKANQNKAIQKYGEAQTDTCLGAIADGTAVTRFDPAARTILHLCWISYAIAEICMTCHATRKRYAMCHVTVSL